MDDARYGFDNILVIVDVVCLSAVKHARAIAYSILITAFDDLCVRSGRTAHHWHVNILHGEVTFLIRLPDLMVGEQSATAIAVCGVPTDIVITHVHYLFDAAPRRRLIQLLLVREGARIVRFTRFDHHECVVRRRQLLVRHLPYLLLHHDCIILARRYIFREPPHIALIVLLKVQHFLEVFVAPRGH